MEKTFLFKQPFILNFGWTGFCRRFLRRNVCSCRSYNKKYTPGETTTPTCVPGTLNCTVESPLVNNFAADFSGTGAFSTTGTITGGTLTDGDCTITGGALSSGCNISSATGGGGAFSIDGNYNITSSNSITGASFSGRNDFIEGNYAGKFASNASSDIFIGEYAGWQAYNTTNTLLLGNNAGHNLYNSSNDIFIGNDAGENLGSVNNTLIIDGFQRDSYSNLTPMESLVYGQYANDGSGSAGYQWLRINGSVDVNANSSSGEDYWLPTYRGASGNVLTARGDVQHTGQCQQGFHQLQAILQGMCWSLTPDLRLYGETQARPAEARSQ